MSVFIDKSHLLHAITQLGMKPVEFVDAGDKAGIPFTLGEYKFRIGIELLEKPGYMENCAVCEGLFWSTGAVVCKECAKKGAR